MLSQIEPKNFDGSIKEKNQIDATDEELDQIEKNKTQELTSRLVRKNVIGTKWVFKNKMNEQGKNVRNKARLVCKGYSQVEGLDYGENFAIVVRIEAIMIFLGFDYYNDFKMYQMDVKHAFLKEELQEVVYMEKPEGFLLLDNPNDVCRLNKALYGFKQDPQAWYYRLDKYIQKQGFKRE